MTADAHTTEKRRAVAALVLLSFFWALDGLAPDLFPILRHGSLPGMERQAITFAFLAAGAIVFAIARRNKRPTRRHAIAWAATGVLMLALPVLLTFAAQAWVSQLDRVAIFSLTPVMAAVLEPHIGNATHRSNGALLAGLIAVAGVLAIFPLSVPGTPAATLAVLAVVTAAACAAIGNCIAVRLATSYAEFSVAVCAAWMCSAAAIAFAVASACVERNHWQFPPSAIQILWLVLVDVPPLLLLFWLLSRMSASRMTARFVLAPLLTVAAGIALEQPQITARVAIGVALLATGAAWLLAANEKEDAVDPIGIL